MNEPTVVEVTCCGDCKFHSFYGQLEWNHCGLSGATETKPDEQPLFSQCPLKKLKQQSITIKLKENGTE